MTLDTAWERLLHDAGEAEGATALFDLCTNAADKIRDLEFTISDLRTALVEASASLQAGMDRELAMARELARYKEAVTDQLHYDMKAVITDTPENRMLRAFQRSEARCKLAERFMMRWVAKGFPINNVALYEETQHFLGKDYRACCAALATERYPEDGD